MEEAIRERKRGMGAYAAHAGGGGGGVLLLDFHRQMGV